MPNPIQKDIPDNEKYYHQTENDICGFCGGYDGCMIECTCPHCREQDRRVMFPGEG